MYGIALILLFGVGAQWLAWRLGVPSILVLLLSGFLAGPVLKILNPDQLLKDLLLPIISLSVALILFEGGMGLRLRDLREVGGVVRNLVTVGAIVSGILTAVASHYILNLHWQLASLLGAILVVTGPTVIGPLLRHVQPAGRLGPILKWEGIVLDPLGAMAAVVVFEAVQFGSVGHFGPILVIAIKTLAVGCAMGAIMASGLILCLRHRWVPDHLHNSLTLMAVAAAYVAANAIQTDSGLFSATIMGIVIANQKSVVVRHIAEFKETLSLLLISSLFIILAARLQLSAVLHIGWQGLVFLAALILVVRPMSVAVSTIGSGLNWRQKLFLTSMAPRGIVAAAVASVFALRLHAAGVAGSESLVPVTFLVIIGTVTVYGLAAAPLGKWLGVAWPNAQGCLIVGAHALSREIAKALQEEGCPVLLLDTNRWNIQQARLNGLPTFLGSIVAQEANERIELAGIGRLLAMTSNDEVNSLAAISFSRAFGRSQVYQLATANQEKAERLSQDLRGRLLFNTKFTYDYLMDHLETGAKIHKTLMTDEFGFKQFQEHYGELAAPLFLLSPGGELTVLTVDEPVAAKPGQILISLAKAVAVAVENNAGEAIKSGNS